jgi:hypothetical protein
MSFSGVYLLPGACLCLKHSGPDRSKGFVAIITKSQADEITGGESNGVSW